MHELRALLETATHLSPLAVMALLALAILMLARQSRRVSKIESNDLHSIEQRLLDMADTLRRLEVFLVRELTWMRARLTPPDEE